MRPGTRKRGRRQSLACDQLVPAPRGGAGVRAYSSAEEHSVYTRAVAGSIPAAPTALSSSRSTRLGSHVVLFARPGAFLSYLPKLMNA